MPKVVTMCEGVYGRGGLESGRSTKEACAPRTALPGPSATKTQRARQATQKRKDGTYQALMLRQGSWEPSDGAAAAMSVSSA